MFGDSALIRVAAAIQQLVCEDDRLFRWGGDEFLLIALNQTAAAVAARLERINPLLAIPGEVAVQVSYGAVEFGGVGELSDAVRNADVVMYARRRERAAAATSAASAHARGIAVPGADTLGPSSALSTIGDG
jgi:diguanylate cyclase (GGDEF)-like protein